ncbi:MAG: hypothetical protein EAX96_05605 [Candidatus Lokiarchaeota archaeon]|nr:hypothetical protein [Candidatus Lokiarchaeota archaeon]
MINSFSFNLEYFYRFELTNLLKFIKLGCYFALMILYFIRVKKRRDEESPYIFEILAGIFFLSMLLGSVWELFTLVFGPRFFGLYLFNQQLFPTINILGFPLFELFTGEMLGYFVGFIGLGILCIGIERASKLKSRGFISIIPFALAIGTLLFGPLMTTLPYYFLALSAAIVPIMFFYVADRSPDELRNKSLIIGLGFFLIFAAEALNYYILLRVVPEWVYIVENAIIFQPITLFPPFICIIGCIFLFIGLKKID